MAKYVKRHLVLDINYWLDAQYGKLWPTPRNRQNYAVVMPHWRGTCSWTCAFVACLCGCVGRPVVAAAHLLQRGHVSVERHELARGHRQWRARRSPAVLARPCRLTVCLSFRDISQCLSEWTAAANRSSCLTLDFSWVIRIVYILYGQS